MLILKKPNDVEPIYVLSLEEYLHPKKPSKCTQLQQFPTNEKQQQQQGNRRKRPSAWSASTKVQPIKLSAKPTATTTTTTPLKSQTDLKANRWRQMLTRWQEKRGVELAQMDEPVLEDAPCNWHSLLGKLPNVLAFLRARNDDGLCKRKTGFEIYCEMASFHGFVHFVGASTVQRAAWFIIICLAIAMSVMVLVMSHLLNVGTPTTIYTESTTHPSWRIPFPAVTLCPVQRLSQPSVTKLAERLIAGTRMPLAQAKRLLSRAVHYDDALEDLQVDMRLLQNLLNAKNVSIAQMYADVQSSCTKNLVRCMWQGAVVQCGQLIDEQQTLQGRCCIFNFDGLTDGARTPHCCDERTGLTLLLRPQRINLTAFHSQFASSIAYQLYVHEPHTMADERLLAPQLLATRTVSDVSVQPRQTYATTYVRGERVQLRRCQFADERPLRTFARYSQDNCLAECWSALAHAQCGCVPVQWPMSGHPHWHICEPTQLACIAAGRENFSQILTTNLSTSYRYDHYAEQFSCDCWPPCEYNQYQIQLEATPLAMHVAAEEQLLHGVEVDEHILVHIHYDDIIAERLRVDVYENWLSFIGTFGGITGLFMGYSVVSAFEMIFFVFVRPACNWLTKKQIRYRVQRKQRQRERERVAAAAATALAANVTKN